MEVEAEPGSDSSSTIKGAMGSHDADTGMAPSVHNTEADMQQGPTMQDDFDRPKPLQRSAVLDTASQAARVPLPPSPASSTSTLPLPTSPKSVEEKATEEEEEDDEAPTCRVCRSSDPSLGPLFHPCRCTGSIAHVHQSCLSTWLDRSRKSSCELCSHRFSFENVYVEGAPEKVPWGTVVREAGREVGRLVGWGVRGVTVGVAWLAVVPWIVKVVHEAGLEVGDWTVRAIVRAAPHASWPGNWTLPSSSSSSPSLDTTNNVSAVALKAFDFAANVTADPSWNNLSVPSVSKLQNGSHSIKLTHPSLPSNHSSPPFLRLLPPLPPIPLPAISDETKHYLSHTLPLSILHGQLITSSLVVAFVVVFLLREYVVQNGGEDLGAGLGDELGEGAVEGEGEAAPPVLEGSDVEPPPEGEAEDDDGGTRTEGSDAEAAAAAAAGRPTRPTSTTRRYRSLPRRASAPVSASSSSTPASTSASEAETERAGEESWAERESGGVGKVKRTRAEGGARDGRRSGKSAGKGKEVDRSRGRMAGKESMGLGWMEKVPPLVPPSSPSTAASSSPSTSTSTALSDVQTMTAFFETLAIVIRITTTPQTSPSSASFPHRHTHGTGKTRDQTPDFSLDAILSVGRDPSSPPAIANVAGWIGRQVTGGLRGRVGEGVKVVRLLGGLRYGVREGESVVERVLREYGGQGEVEAWIGRREFASIVLLFRSAGSRPESASQAAFAATQKLQSLSRGIRDQSLLDAVEQAWSGVRAVVGGEEGQRMGELDELVGGLERVEKVLGRWLVEKGVLMTLVRCPEFQDHVRDFLWDPEKRYEEYTSDPHSALLVSTALASLRDQLSPPPPQPTTTPLDRSSLPRRRSEAPKGDFTFSVPPKRAEEAASPSRAFAFLNAENALPRAGESAFGSGSGSAAGAKAEEKGREDWEMETQVLEDWEAPTQEPGWAEEDSDDSDDEVEVEPPMRVEAGPDIMDGIGAVLDAEMNAIEAEERANDPLPVPVPDPVPAAPPAADVPAPAVVAAAAADQPANDEFEEAELVLEDLDGLLEAVGFRGPVLALVQNVGLVVILLGGGLILFVHFPHVIGKAVILCRADLAVLAPFRGLLVLRDAAHSFLDRTAALARRFGRTDAGKLAEIRALLARLLRHRPTPALGSTLSGNRHLVAAQGLISRAATTADAQTQSLVQSALLYVESLRATARWISTRLENVPSGTSVADRIIAVALGYVFGLFLVVCYLISGIDRARSQTFGVALTRVLRQLGVIVKVGTFIFVELVVFPAVCGALLNLTTLPAMPGATLAGAVHRYRVTPFTNMLLTWLSGTCFMFIFAMFVSTCRDNLRPGVCWWIRDPGDPRYHPIRDIINRPTLSQIKKITASAAMYGAVIVLGFGAILLTLQTFAGLLPLRLHFDRPWTRTGIDLILYQNLLPVILSAVEPRQRLREVLDIFSRQMAHTLRLSSFLYGERCSIEERSRPLPDWYKSPLPIDETSINPRPRRTGVIDESMGSFMRVPASDTVHFVPGRKMFISVTEDGVPLHLPDMSIIRQQRHESQSEPGAEPDADDYTVCYIPTSFRTRIIAWVVSMWLISVSCLAILTGVPLLMGRATLDALWTEEQHDAYAFAAGVTVLAGLAGVGFACWKIGGWLAALWKASPLAQVKAQFLNRTAAWTFIGASVELVEFLIGATAGLVAAPILASLAVELYILAPLRPKAAPLPTIYLTDTWSSGVTYLALATRIVCMHRLFRPPEAIRNAWTEGNVRQTVRLANRHIILPVTAALAFAVLGPAAALGPIILLMPHSVLAPIIRRAGWEALSSADHFFLLLKSLYPALPGWYSHYITSRLVAKMVNQWLGKVRDRTFLDHRRLRNYEATPAAQAAPQVQ